MNTDDRALADLIEQAAQHVFDTSRKGTWRNTANEHQQAADDAKMMEAYRDIITKAVPFLIAADRLEAFHAKPDGDDIERDVRIAIWNAGMKGGMGQDLSQAFIVRAMAEPTMVRALAALQSPPPVVSGEAENLLAASPDDYWAGITAEVEAAGKGFRHAHLLNHQAAHLLAWANIARDAAKAAPVVEEGRRDV